MILDRNERLLVSSVGWIDRGGFVLRDLSTDKIVGFPGDESAFVRLFPIDGDRFLTASHAPEGDRMHLAVRPFSDPARVLWSLRVTPCDQIASGDPREAVGICRHHLATFKNGGLWDHHLVTVNSDGAGAVLGALPWYNSERYDLSYQGLTDVVALPGTHVVLVSVQRSSTIIVHDPTASREDGRLDLAGRHGNPLLTMVGNELWTIDYDTFVRVSLPSRKVVQKVLLQPAAHGTMQFAGELFVWKARRKAVISRPFSGDIAVVDPDSGTIECVVALGRQPLSFVVTDSGRVIARDWKSGDWIEGSMPRATRSWWRFW
jgi:hypothetical protein